MAADARMKALHADPFAGYRLIVDNYPDGALVVYDTDLRYVVAGGLGIAGYGMSKEKLEGRTIWEALPADACAVAEPHYRAALLGEPSTFDVELNGQTLQIKVTPIRDGDRVVGGLICSRNATAGGPRPPLSPTPSSSSGPPSRTRRSAWPSWGSTCGGAA